MGFSITWCAVREENADSFLQQLGLTPTGETEEFPESLISTVALHTGWRVIWYNEYDCPFLRPQDLRELSKHTEVLLCLVEEHVMASSAEMWSNGKRKWWLSHEGEDGPSGIASEGELPQSFPAIRENLEQAQLAAGGADADVDYMFDIPLTMAVTLVGFRHDENIERLADGHFIVLSRKGDVPAGSFLKRLFRK